MVFFFGEITLCQFQEVLDYIYNGQRKPYTLKYVTTLVGFLKDLEWR